MLYSTLSDLLGTLLGLPDGFPKPNANSLITVIDSGTGAVSLAQIETQLDEYLLNSPISTIVDNLPEPLQDYQDALANALTVSQMIVGCGEPDGDSFDVNSFAFTLTLDTSQWASIGGLTMEDVAVALNFICIGSGLAFVIELGGQCTFCGATCSLGVNLSDPQIVIEITDGDPSDINDILNTANEGTSIESLTTSMDVDMNDDTPSLYSFVAYAALSDTPTFSCMIAMNTSTWNWGPGGFDLDGASVAFSYGSEEFFAQIDVIATVGGIGLSTSLSYTSITSPDQATSSTISFVCQDTSAGMSIGEFLNNLSSELSFTNPLPVLDDVLLDAADILITYEDSVLSFDIKVAVTMAFDNLGTSLACQFHLTGTGGSDAEAIATLTLNDMILELSAGGGDYSFSLTGSGNALPLEQIVQLAQLTPLYGIANDLDIEIDDMLLVFQEQTGLPYKKLFVFDFSMMVDVDNDTLNMLLNGATFGISQARISAASQAWSMTELSALKNGAASFTTAVPEGINLSATLQIGSETVATPLQPPSTNTSPTASPSPPAPVNSLSSATWFDVQTQVGPIDLQKLGFGFLRDPDNGIEIELLADAALIVGPFTAAFDGFSITIPFTEPKNFSLGLQGLELSYSTPELTLAGGLMRESDTVYSGDITFATPLLALSAIGEYAQVEDNTSLAVFAAMTKPPLGGPGWCFITGLSAGLGYNSHLNVPTRAADVAAFALVEAATTGIDPEDPFSTIDASVTPMVGDDWIALGINFTCYDVIRSTVLLSGEIGTDLEFDVFGQAEMSIPPITQHRLAYAELDVEARFVLSDFMIWVEGALSKNSYILDPNCHVSGGFLFTVQSDGLFILSFGGYAPDFDYESLGYPPIDAAGVSWHVDALMSFDGSGYFALTPAAMMAGGDLTATWHCGVFSASFNTTVELLIQWRPFAYSGDFAMMMTAEFEMKVAFVSVHIDIHLGAQLHVAGPPFHGSASVDLDIFTLNIDFGDTPDPETTLDWDDFRATLPGDPNNDADASDLLTATVIGGLQQLISSDDQTEPNVDTDWVVSGPDLAVTLQTAIPISETSTGDVSITTSPLSTTLGILPMDVSSATSTFDVVLTNSDNETIPISSDSTSKLMVTGINQQLSTSQWGVAAPTDVNASALQCTAGYLISAGRPNPNSTAPAQLSTLLADITPIIAQSTRVAFADPFTN